MRNKKIKIKSRNQIQTYKQRNNNKKEKMSKTIKIMINKNKKKQNLIEINYLIVSLNYKKETLKCISDMNQKTRMRKISGSNEQGLKIKQSEREI